MIYLTGLHNNQMEKETLRGIYNKFSKQFEDVICPHLTDVKNECHKNFFLTLLKNSSELWVYIGPEWQEDVQLKREVNHAKLHNIKIKYIRWDF